MGKFMIECPKCHRFNEASSGLFARRNILCSCGNIINVRNDRIVTRVCPECGNTVIYDQAKGPDATCPVCKKQLVTQGDISRMIHFPCATCGCILQAGKSEAILTCPLCGAENDVQQEVKKAQLREKGEPAVIEYRGDRKTLVWRHPMTEFVYGSQLIVREGQEAIFLRNGEALDSFGPGRHLLETPALPKLNERSARQPDTAQFRAEVYFVNMATQFNLKWGTPGKVSFRDPETGIPIELGASGGFSLRVSNPRKLLGRVVGTQEQLETGELFDPLNGDFRMLVLGRIKSCFAKCVQDMEISILDLSARQDEIAKNIQAAVNLDLESYGIELPDFTVITIVLPEDDPAYQRLREYHINRGMGVREVRLETDIKRAEIERVTAEAMAKAAEKRILAEAEADAYLARAKAEAEEMKQKGYTYQQETQRQVATAAMESSAAAGLVNGIAAQAVQLEAGRQTADMLRSALGETARSFEGGAAASAPESWDCACGCRGITSRFCPDCGQPRPDKPAGGWDCPCGRKNNVSRFCPDCGRERPAAGPWNCACGARNISSRFCPECGSRRP